MITRDADPHAVADLALAPPRATLAAVVDDEITALPVDVELEEPAEPGLSPRRVRVPLDTPDLNGRDVVVVADDGPEWFRLRSLTVRGPATAIGDRLYRISPRRVVAWDYGQLREVPAEPPTPDRPAVSFAGAVEDVPPLHSAELEEALRVSHVMIVATRSRKANPFAVPLWFVVHDGAIYVSTSASSWTVRNVAACPDICLLLGGERGSGREPLVVRAHARAVIGFPRPGVLAKSAWRYYLRPAFAAVELAHIRLWGKRMRYYGQARPAHVVITPVAIEQSAGPV